jgi:hypothetical protein
VTYSDEILLAGYYSVERFIRLGVNVKWCKFCWMILHGLVVIHGMGKIANSGFRRPQ